MRTVKLTEAEKDVLTAYRDNGSHNRNPSVTGSLIRKGYLVYNPVTRTLEITDSGKTALGLS